LGTGGRRLDGIGESVEVLADARQRSAESSGGGDDFPVPITPEEPEQLPYPGRDDSERAHGALTSNLLVSLPHAVQPGRDWRANSSSRGPPTRRSIRP
jgi:hypothetical protein